MGEHRYTLLTSEGKAVIQQDVQWQITWRGINAVFVVFFLLAAFVNINDDDGFIWVPVYAIPALLSLAIVIYPKITDYTAWRVITVIHMSLCAAGALYLLAIVLEILSGKITNPLEHEEGRELGGLAIIELWLIVCRFTTIGSSEPGKGGMKMLLLVTGIFALLPLFVWGLCFVGGLHKKLGHCKDMFRD